MTDDETMRDLGFTLQALLTADTQRDEASLLLRLRALGRRWTLVFMDDEVGAQLRRAFGLKPQPPRAGEGYGSCIVEHHVLVSALDDLGLLDAARWREDPTEAMEPDCVRVVLATTRGLMTARVETGFSAAPARVNAKGGLA